LTRDQLLARTEIGLIEERDICAHGPRRTEWPDPTRCLHLVRSSGSLSAPQLLLEIAQERSLEPSLRRLVERAAPRPHLACGQADGHGSSIRRGV
jgi:hypothetical protein